MHTRDRIRLVQAVTMARTANWLGIAYRRVNPEDAKGWHDRSRKHLAAARIIKAASS